MAELPRLNGVIRALEQGQHAFTCFSPAEVNTAVAMSTSKFDGCVFEMEHSPWDGRRCAIACNTCSTARRSRRRGSLAPAVTPMVRVPVNGVEMAQWQAKQALDIGCYGIVLPHISTVEEAANAVGACRYPRLKDRAAVRAGRHPRRRPGDAARYWGLTQQEYYQKADVWPLNPQGEIFCILQIEDTRGVENLDEMLAKVPGIGAILIGEGDLSQELGYPRQYEHKVVLEWMKRVVDTCKKHNVVVGHPHVEHGNAERIVSEGYRFLMCAPVQSYGHLEAARKHTGRLVFPPPFTGEVASESEPEEGKWRLAQSKPAPSTALTRGPPPPLRGGGRSPHLQPALLLDEARDLVNARAGAQVGENERTRAAHALRLALHGFQRGADIRREIDLVDHQKVGAGDAGAALGGNLVAGGDIDHVDRQIGQLRRKGRGKIVAARTRSAPDRASGISAACRRWRRDWRKRPRGSPCAGSRRSRRRRCARAPARPSAPDIRRPIWCRCRW